MAEAVKSVRVSDLSGKEIAGLLPSAITKVKIVTVQEDGSENAEIELDCLPVEATCLCKTFESLVNKRRSFAARVEEMRAQLGPDVPAHVAEALVLALGEQSSVLRLLRVGA
jgi:hypothetical protein